MVDDVVEMKGFESKTPLRGRGDKLCGGDEGIRTDFRCP
jgi:hypothetical protein